MGRHSTAPVKRKQTPVHRLWRRLPEPWRARVWERRQRWRSFWDRRHIPDGEWDALLPNDASSWTDDLNWGSFTVAAALRKHRRERGDLLPEHRHDQEKS